jgi:hypothetical protein
VILDIYPGSKASRDAGIIQNAREAAAALEDLYRIYRLIDVHTAWLEEFVTCGI